MGEIVKKAERPHNADAGDNPAGAETALEDTGATSGNGEVIETTMLDLDVPFGELVSPAHAARLGELAAGQSGLDELVTAGGYNS